MDFTEALLVDTFRYSFFAFFVSISGVLGLAWSFLVLKSCINFSKKESANMNTGFWDKVSETVNTSISNSLASSKIDTNPKNENTDLYTVLLTKMLDKAWEYNAAKDHVD